MAWTGIPLPVFPPPTPRVTASNPGNSRFGPHVRDFPHILWENGGIVP